MKEDLQRYPRADQGVPVFRAVVSSEFKAWVSTERARAGKTMAAFLDDMRVAYKERQKAND
jgi:hypothetical protein